MLTAALAALLAGDPSVLLIGEDLADPYGGAFKVTAGLSTRFPDRVLCTPISEAGVVGAAIGLALAGARPVVEIMFADFLTLALDQIYNHAVKLPLLHGGQPLPLVIRTPSGGGRGYGPTHSQSPENLAAAIPGLVVVAPSHRHDPAALLAAALALGRPVLFFEHKLLYGRAVDGGGYAVLPGAMGLDAAFPTLVAMAEAPDLTIVTFGGTLPLVEEAAAILRRDEELVVEILVPSLLAPDSFRTIARRVRPCANLLVVEEGPTAFGIGAELAAIFAEAGFRGRVRRLGAPPQPIPAARAMEAAVLPSVAAIVDSGVRLFLSDVLDGPGEAASRPPSGF
ncbi:MAG: alpha-ketoacid dehydrogenase subunit beta [Magnetospirillum sp.]|nr:MAG: alpha-ketoacid dehydrogenase subunit beta [Magnetospirillum sp.]